MNSHLAVDRLRVRLGGAVVLQDISFAVQPGEWIALIGPNGAGKSTLLRAASGLLPFDGQILLKGRPVGDWSARERAREVALVRQHAEPTAAFTAAETVALGRAPHVGWLSALHAADREAVANALDAMDLTDLAHRPVTQLSGGEQQRVLLAQALAQDAQLLLLDEPTAHLDVRHQLDLLSRSKALAKAGRTVIAAVHDLEMAARFADRLLVLDRGRLVANASPAEVLTPDLVRDVFSVDAEIEHGSSGVRLQYLRATQSA